MKRLVQLMAAGFGAAAIAVSVGSSQPIDALARQGTQTQTAHTSVFRRPMSSRGVNSPSEQAMPIGDIPGWHQVFADDFNTAVPLGSFPNGVTAKWCQSYPDGWHDTTGHGTYYPSKVVSIGKGVMNLHLHTENGVHIVAAPVPTIPGAIGRERGLQYGRYAVRFRADALPGYKTAWLLWPDSENWPHDGEIDFPEGNFNAPIKAFVHLQGGTSSTSQDEFATTATYTSWHTAVIEWTPNRVEFSLDNTPVGTSTNQVPNTPMHWVLQTETATIGTSPVDSTSGNVQIDWVAAYTQSGAALAPIIRAPPIARTAAMRTAALAARSLVAPRIPKLRAKGGVDMTINAPATGTAIARLTAKNGTRTIVLGTIRVRLTCSGKKMVKVPLTRAARMLLKGRKRTLGAKLTVIYKTGAVTGTATRAIIFESRRRPTPRLAPASL